MVPRTQSGLGPLIEALANAKVPHQQISEDQIEIAGSRYRVMALKAVRDRDATLVVHFETERATEPTIVVAERISASAREQLRRARVAWLDRRGHLWIQAKGLIVNTQVPPSTVPPTRVVDILSGTGLDISVALLTSPDEAQGVNDLARRIGRSPGRVSEVLKALRSEGLVEAGNRPAVPELFWDVAERWAPRWAPLSLPPPPDPRDRYRLSGTLGAVALGAPMAGGARSWPQLYVQEEADIVTLVQPYGAGGATAAEVALCPTRFGFSLISGVERDGYAVASHLLVAFDIAQDRARGRQILDGWNPAEAPRVW